MKIFDLSRACRAAVVLIGLGALTACGESTDALFPVPDEPVGLSMYDLMNGPINRPSALNVLTGRSSGVPTVLRVDAAEQWDLSFGMIEGVPVWLPRGFFEGLDISSGVFELDVDFDDVTFVPTEDTLYVYEQPVDIEVGKTYAIKSRPDPTVSITCVLYAIAEVLVVEGDPARLEFQILWNPNCNENSLAN
jgi:hypothetical protein